MTDIGIIVTTYHNDYEHQFEVKLKKYTLEYAASIKKNINNVCLPFKTLLEKKIKEISENDFTLKYYGPYKKYILFSLNDAKNIYKTVHYKIFHHIDEKYGYVQMNLKFDKTKKVDNIKEKTIDTSEKYLNDFAIKPKRYISRPLKDEILEKCNQSLKPLQKDLSKTSSNESAGKFYENYGQKVFRQVREYGSIWYTKENGLFHREDGAAIIHNDGTKEYYLDGHFYTRENYLKFLGMKTKTTFTIKNQKSLIIKTVNGLGNFHSIDDAISSQDWDMKAWYFNGMLHRENGPAIIRADGTTDYYKFGKKIDIYANPELENKDSKKEEPEQKDIKKIQTGDLVEFEGIKFSVNYMSDESTLILKEN